MSKHTPGPWTIGDENNQRCEVILGASDLIADLGREDRYTGKMVISRQEMLDNAHLIAAAPCLLSACEAIIADSTPWASDTPALMQVRTAIAKARGEA